jgi:site-specific recombinase XerC
MIECQQADAAQAEPADDDRVATDPWRSKPRNASPETLRLYAADWTAFETWCAGTARNPLPADPDTVAAFLAEAAQSLSSGSLGRRASAIGARHRQHGFASPVVDRAVKAVLSAARQNAAPRPGLGPAPAQLIRMAAACRGDLIGLRDRALLLLLAAGGLGPSALVGLDVEHIRFSATEAELTLNAAGEQIGRLTIPNASNPSICPVHALHDWLLTSDTRFGPIFRKIDRWGNLEHCRLSPGAVRRIVVRLTPRRSRKFAVA